MLDESGFMLQPMKVRTWAPRGQPPVLDCWHRHDRLSVISAVTVSPTGRRFGLYFQVLYNNVTTDDVVRFVRSVRRKLGRRLTVVWDRLKAHQAAAHRLPKPTYETISLPGYAPDLNPDEWVWRQAKHVDLKNACPTDTGDLHRHVHDSLCSMHKRPRLLKGFFRAAGLSL